MMLGIFMQCVSSLVLVIPNIVMAVVVTWPSYSMKAFQSEQSPIGRNASPLEVNFIGSIPMLGSLISSALTGYFAERFGKKKCSMCTGICYLISWTIITWSNSIYITLVGRFISGIAGGIHTVVSSAYIGEFSQDLIRGALSSLPIAAYAGGLLIAYILGWICTYDTVNYVAMGMSLIFVVLIFFLKETPIYLFSKGREKEAMISLKFYRGYSTFASKELLDESTSIKRQLQHNSEKDNGYIPISKDETRQVEENNIMFEGKKLSSWGYLCSSKIAQRQLLLCTLLIVLPIFMGLIAIFTYAGQLFSKTAPNLSSDLCSVILALVTLIGSIVSTSLADYAGRRILMLSSCVMVSLSMALLGTLLRWSWGPEWMVPLFILSFCFSYNIGVGTVPFVLAAECFVPEIKNFALTTIMSLMWVSCFIILLIFDPLTNALGLDGIFFLFSSVGVATTCVVVFLMPETKGLSLSYCNKMGLLSDPEYGSVKWVRILRKIHGPLSFLCYISAIVWFVMLGNKAFNNETYFSENALLPGLVTNEFNGEQYGKQLFNEFVQELEDKYDENGQMPVPWLVGKMSQINLEVYTHNFTLDYPIGHGQVFNGINVYGILRAPRTASLEALVVSAPYRSLSSHQKGTAAGIALMLAFAKFARSQKYWAKDIIFLVTEHEQLGMQAWLEAYHGIVSDTDTFYTSLGSFWKADSPSLGFGDFGWNEHKKCLNPGKLKGLSGSIQAAINLEFHTPKIKYIEVKVEGLNGQLPNLDLVNLVHKLCVKSGIHHSYKNSYSWIKSRSNVEEWTNSVWTMLGMVSTQLAGVPNGNHGLFHRFGIEAVTLEGRGQNDPAGLAPRVNALSSANFYRLGVALESILRSLNNLLERFHQSYFFYLLAATNRFVSIGQYMPCLCLFCVAMLLRALAFWVTLQSDFEEHSKTKKEHSKAKEEQSKTSNDSISNEEGENEELEEESKRIIKKKAKKHSDQFEDTNIVGIGANYLIIHMLGYAVMNSPTVLSTLGEKYFQFHSEMSVYYGLAILSVLLTVITPFLPRFLHRTRISYEEMTLVNVLLLIELSTICLAVGMHNFPLGLCLGILYTPLALIVSVTSEESGRVCLLLKHTLCLLVHPLSAITLGMIAYSAHLYPEDTVWSMIGRGRDAAMQATMFSVVDALIYGNWLFNIAASLILPTWILYWQILCIRVPRRLIHSKE